MTFNQDGGTERYLRAATRGLWGQERRALQTELRGHISARVQEFRLGGLSEAEAERQTLRELGAPVQVSGGMLGVHTWPALGKAGALTALLMTGLLSVLPQGLAQVNAKFFRPSDQASMLGEDSFLDLDQLRAELRAQGGDLAGPSGNLVLSIPESRFPSATLDTDGVRGSTIQGGHPYIRSTALLYGLFNTGADLRLSGWNPVAIHAGRAVLTIQTGGDSRVSNSLYQNLLGSFASETNTPVLTPQAFQGQSDAVQFQGAITKGSIYAWIVPVFSTWSTEENGVSKVGGHVVLSMDVNVSEAGRVVLRKYGATDFYKLQPSAEAFRRALDPDRTDPKISFFDARHPAPALLVKLSGKFGNGAFTVVDPATIKISP